MKNFLILVVALAYLGTSTGATLRMHYCMGKLADWGIVYNESHACGKCSSKKSGQINNDCCKDELKVIKSTGDQKITETAFQPLQLIIAGIPSSFITISSTEFSAIADENPTINAPPRRNGIPIYIYDCTFLI